MFTVIFALNMYRFSLIFIAFIISQTLTAQELSPRVVEVGAEVQKYPTGILLTVRAEFSLKLHHAIDFRIGYNGLDHEDFGVHDSEIGGGFGGSVGYRYYFKESHVKWFVGARTDLWNNEVDWIDFDEQGQIPIAEGVSDIFVLQPTILVGYHWMFREHFVFTPTAAFGAEINIITDGADIGQGPILLLGANLTYRF